MLNSADMVAMLDEKFENTESLQYYFKEISTDELNPRRCENQHKEFKTIEGSSKFQVAVFTPDSRSFRAAIRLCICNSCKVEYGSCNFFETYIPIVNQLRVPTLRSDYQNFQQDQESDPKSDDISLSKDLVVAVAAADKSLDTVWFVKITEEMRTDKNAVLFIKNPLSTHVSR